MARHPVKGRYHQTRQYMALDREEKFRFGRCLFCGWQTDGIPRHNGPNTLRALATIRELLHAHILKHKELFA